MVGGRRYILWAIRFIVVLAMFCAVPGTSLATNESQATGDPDIGARAAIVVEYPSGRVLYSRAMHDHLAPASTTKILTAILALESGKLEEEVTVAPEDLVGESTMGLQTGEHQTLHNLLYGMLLPSGNDAAMAVARYLGAAASGQAAEGKGPMQRFADMMNAKAEQLGLADSHFVNPNGLDAEGHYSSAYDLASLTWYALHFPTFNEIVGSGFYDAPGHPLRNTNEMLTRYPGSDGVKTGWTDAGGLCLVTSATRDGHRLIAVVLNAPHWYVDSAALLDYGFAKLAANPQDNKAEALLVASSRTASRLLLNSALTSQVPAVLALAQGGGAASQPKVDQAASADMRSSNAPPEPRAVSSTGNSNILSASARVVTAQPRSPFGQLLWLLLITTIAATVGIVFYLRRSGWVFPRSFALAFPPRLAAKDFRASTSRQSSSSAYVRTHYYGGGGKPRPVSIEALPRRREPNLLASDDEIVELHVVRALALAAEERQGSSMAEFMLALRQGRQLSASDLASAQNVTPAAFLALSRAQLAVGDKVSAYSTLIRGVEWAPTNRMLHLALCQLTVKKAA